MTRSTAMPEKWMPRRSIPEDESGVIELYKYFLGAYPRRTAVMIVLMITAGMAEGVGVLTLIPVLNLAQGSGLPDEGVGRYVSDALGAVGLSPTLTVLLVLICVAISVKAILLQIAQTQVGYTVSGVVRDLRLNLMRALFAVRWSYFGEHTVGKFANSATSEAQRAGAAYKEATAVVAAILQMVGYLAVAFLISWPVALAAMLAGAGLGLFSRLFVSKSRRAGKQQTVGMRALSSRLVDVLQGIKPLKAMARQHLVWPMLEHETERINTAQRDQISASETMKAFHEPTLVILLAIGIYAVVSVSEQSLTETLVLAFVFYRIVVHINSLQVRYQVMVNGESAFYSLRAEMEELEAQREASHGAKEFETLREGIRFRDVSFAYERGVPVLDGVDFFVPAGTFTAIQGPSGSGKTTLVDLLVGLHKPLGGEILIDGVPLDEIDLGTWQGKIGYVPQEMLLFNDTLRNNLTLGDDRFTREEVESTLRQAGAWDFVSSHRLGVEQPIGERGVQLSGGQRQRIAIARALLGSPSLLILDEATTSLDPETERGICDTLRSLAGSVTILSISHQPAMKRVADLVFTLREGRLLEESLAPIHVTG